MRLPPTTLITVIIITQTRTRPVVLWPRAPRSRMEFIAGSARYLTITDSLTLNERPPLEGTSSQASPLCQQQLSPLTLYWGFGGASHSTFPYIAPCTSSHTHTHTHTDITYTHITYTHTTYTCTYYTCTHTPHTHYTCTCTHAHTHHL